MAIRRGRDDGLRRLEADLRARRSDAPAWFLQSLAERVRGDRARSGPGWVRPGVRLGLVFGLVALALIAVASAGGFRSSVSHVTAVVHVVKHVAQPRHHRPVRVAQTPAEIQYGLTCGSPPHMRCRVRIMPFAVTVHEPTSGSLAVNLTVALNLPSDGSARISYSTLDGTARAANGDYVPVPLTQLVFGLGEQYKTVTVYVLADNIREFLESFFVKLSNPVNVSVLFPGTSRITIIG